jgi:hypothetical protein
MQIIAHALIQLLWEKLRSGLGGRFSVRLCHVRDLSQKRDANGHSPRIPYASKIPHTFNRRAAAYFIRLDPKTMSKNFDQFKFATNQIRRLLESAEKTSHVSLVVAPETNDYIDKLELRLRRNPDKTKSLISALISKHIHWDELLLATLPESVQLLQQRYLATRNQKESDVATGQFMNAAICRDEEQQILSELSDLLDGEQIVITPQHLIDAFASMGFSFD